MKKASLIIFCLLVQVCQVNGQFLKDGLGRPIKENKYINVDGSPYLFDNWLKGDVKSNDGITDKSNELKYDVVEDRILFKGEQGVEMDFVDLIVSFTLFSDEGKRNFRRFADITEYQGIPFFEVLNEGEKLILLKKAIRSVMYNKAYGSATTTKSFSQTIKYYLLKNDGSYVRIKKDKGAIMAALADKAAEMDLYLKTNKTDFRKEEDLGKLFTYYNTL